MRALVEEAAGTIADPKGVRTFLIAPVRSCALGAVYRVGGQR